MTAPRFISLACLGAVLFSAATFVSDANAQAPATKPEGKPAPAAPAAEGKPAQPTTPAPAPPATPPSATTSTETPPSAAPTDPASATTTSETEAAAADAPVAEDTTAAPGPETPAEATPPESEDKASTEAEKTSASANQKVPPPRDDYEGASESALVESKPKPKNLVLGIGLDLTWPLGSAANFIGSASIQGLSVDLRYYVWKNVGIGAGVAFDAVSKKTDGTVVWDNATFTGTQLREISYTPLTLKGYYAWRDAEKVVPYLALGAGAARTVRRLIVGFSSLSNPSWHFVVVPEAGLHIPAGPTLLQANVRLGYLPPAGGTDEQVFANFSFGLAIQ